MEWGMEYVMTSDKTVFKIKSNPIFNFKSYAGKPTQKHMYPEHVTC